MFKYGLKKYDKNQRRFSARRKWNVAGKK